MIAATELRLVVVTPEKTLLDKPVQSLQFPLFDGQIGVLPGRAPLVGRLGTGELKFVSGNTEEHFFIDGGFAQIKGSVVTLLTSHAQSAQSIDVNKAQKDLERALESRPENELGFQHKAHQIDRARKQINLRNRL